MDNRYRKNRGKWMTGENDFLQIPGEPVWSDDVFLQSSYLWKILEASDTSEKGIGYGVQILSVNLCTITA